MSSADRSSPPPRSSSSPSSPSSSSSSSSSHRSRPPTCPDENELVLLADGALGDKRRASIDRHLDGCAPCTLLVAELAGMAAPVRPVPSRYKVIRQLGAGAMGVVWEAEDKHLGRRVALKFVRADASTAASRTASSAAAHRERRTRLFREARALAQLRHPNVVSVYDVGESADELFLALELVIGMDARTWRAAHPRTTSDILAVWRQAAAGLAAVHRAGMLHRDIKPDNILVADDGRVLLGDFGLATDHQHHTLAEAPHPPSHSLADRRLTATGAIVGTPLYMAYEQLMGEPATQKSDQYALCVSIWEALAGQRPFAGPTLGAIAMAMQSPPSIPPTVPARDRALFTVLARGLDANPAKRWPNIDALLAALDAPHRAARHRSPRAGSRGAGSRGAGSRGAGSRNAADLLAGSRLAGSARTPSRAGWLALGTAALAAAATIGVLAWREPTRPRDVASVASSATSAATHAREAALRDATPTERAITLPSRLDAPRAGDPRADDPRADSALRRGHDNSTGDVPPGTGVPKARAKVSASPARDGASGAANNGSTNATSPNATSPNATSPNATSPNATSPNATSPTGVVTHSDWKLQLDRATDKLGFGDGTGCLQILAAMPPVPAVMEEQAETLRAMCTMKVGDCTRGRAMLETTARANGWDAARTGEVVRNADFAYCPLDAGPRERWVGRAKFRLQHAAGTRASCKPVLAFMAKHGVELADRREQRLLETTCRVNDGDCRRARVSWRQAFAEGETEPARIAEREQWADAAFVRSFPACP